jgi:RNA polymerase sigma-70 factor (ECF subfamily)
MKFIEDQEIRRGLLCLEPTAVNAFVGHFVPVLGKMAKARGLSKEEAEDTIQECFAVFFRKIALIEDHVKLSTFLFGVFLNSVRETRRRRGRAEAHGDLASVEHLVAEQYDARGHWKVGVSPLPLEQVLELEKGSKLAECLEGLPDKHKEAVLLTLHEDGDPKDICHILGVSYANFRQLMTRARHALRLCLENYAREI